MEEEKKKNPSEIRLRRGGEMESWQGGWVKKWGEWLEESGPAAEKVFKYSRQTRSGPINGKSFFDDSEIYQAGHCPPTEIDKTKKK